MVPVVPASATHRGHRLPRCGCRGDRVRPVGSKATQSYRFGLGLLTRSLRCSLSGERRFRGEFEKREKDDGCHQERARFRLTV